MRRRRRPRWTTIGSGVVLGVGIAAFVVGAVVSHGVPVRHVDLNDGGVWVTSDAEGLFGRLNKPAGALDAAFYPPGGARADYRLDVAQDGAAVVAWDQGAGKLYPVDVDRGATVGDQGTPLGAQQQVGLAGGTLAVLDAKSGKVWASRVDTAHGVSTLNALEQSGPPLATVGEGGADAKAALAVGLDGTVFAVSSAGRVATVHPAPGTGFAAVQYGRLDRPLGSVTATVVGQRLAVLDPTSGAVEVPGGATVSLPDSAGAVVQAPGPAATSVVVATARALLSVDLATGKATTLGSAAGGRPAAPVRLDDCVHAAWAGEGGGYFRSCGGAPAQPGNLKDSKVLQEPVFRVNRGQIVLNDLSNGNVWDLTDQRKVDNWTAVRPPPVQQPNGKSTDKPNTVLAKGRPPKAVDDTLGARPGRTTLLHVLDNDSDPGGNILSVTAVTAPDVASATLAIAPDGQTVAVSLPAAEKPGEAVHFKYTVDDGAQASTAVVTVQVRAPGENKAPELRPNYVPPVWTVTAGGRLSLPVLADWRDFDGDPIALTGAATKTGTATTTPEGFLNLTAPNQGGPMTVNYQVSDGLSQPVPGSVTVTVQPPTATNAVAATTQPDVARGEVGQPITIHPLDNDLPGTDPTNPAARLALAGEVASPAGTTVVTDLHAGTVVVTASRPGPFLMTYTVAFGNAPFATGHLRVDVVPVPTAPAPPVAMPDTAVLHGQLPTTVDVLANDFDPAGAVLVVERATPAGDHSQLQVAVVAGHWLRINAVSAAIDPQPLLVRYTVTDGVTGPVTGEVTVTRLPDPPDTTPVPQDDDATVRAGDTVTVAVLDNDTNPGGAAMTLVPDVPGAPGPGQLTVGSVGVSDRSTLGAAYVSGNLVRYLAPGSAARPLPVTVDYLVQNAAGDTAVGHLHVLVEPAPSPTNPNRPPAPRPIEARAIAGQTVTVTVPTGGIDPDGDSVTVSGIASAPTLGRVVSVNATSVTYQAYPASAGTEQFDYRVTDRFGGTGQASIRIGVTPPGTPQPPVAVDDAVTASPGAALRVDVLRNDIVAAGDTVTIQPLDRSNPSVPAGVGLAGPRGPITLTAPGLSGKPLVVAYAISDGIGQPSTATLTVRTQDKYDVPPAVADAYPTIDQGGATVTVKVTDFASDPDGDARDLSVTHVYDAQATVSGTSIVLRVGDRPRVVAYEVRDVGGATALGLVHVPVPGDGAPYVKPGATVTVPRGGSTEVSLADYVLDPAGKAVRLTTNDRIWASPPAALKAASNGDRKLVLTAGGGYSGPGALVIEVTDGATLTDPAAHTAVLSIPVQVGPPTPVLHCPADPLTVVEGGDPQDVDIATVCHVWVADPATLPRLTYTASWVSHPAGVDLTGGSGGRHLVVTAGSSAVPGSTGTIKVAVDGSDAVAAQLPVRVLAAEAPSVAPVTVDGVKAGDSAVVDLRPYVHSQLRAPAVAVLQVSQASGMPATASASGASVTIRPDPQAHGTVTFVVTVTDVADHGRTDRQATGRIVLHVLGVPDAPAAPEIGRTVLSASVELSWSAPPNNGAPIEVYEIGYQGGTQSCPASPCLITGLHNGTAYTFTVRARNLVGWGKPSAASASATPNRVPDAATGLVTSDPQDGSLRLAWNPPHNDGTAILRYDVSWSGGGFQSTGSPGLTATGLTNDSQYVFTVVAVNALGPGPAATVTGQSAGAPPTPPAPTLSSVDSADSKTRAVQVSWPAVDPNGPGPTTYTVTRTGGGSKTVCASVTVRSCDDDGLANDGTVYTYTLTAANAVAATSPAGHTSAASPGAQLEATATPDPITNVSASPTGTDGQATLHFDVGDSHGASSTVSCNYSGGSCGTWTFPTSGQSGVVQTVNGLPNGQGVNLTLTDCNGSHGGAGAGNPCDSPVSAPVTAYGPLRNLSIGTSASGTTVNFTVSVDPNGRPATVTVQTSRQNQTFTTGVGAWSWSSADDVGYSSSDTITVTVSDSARSPLSQQKTQGTGPPPPPPPTVTVSKGAPCGFGGNPACPGGGTCATTACARIHVATANFGGNVTCSFNSQHGPGGFINDTYGPNQSKDSIDWYGYSGEWVQATCGGVTGQFTWP